MSKINYNGWLLEINGDEIRLLNGKVLKWDQFTQDWLDGLSKMWELEPSEGLANLIEMSTGFRPNFTPTDTPEK